MVTWTIWLLEKRSLYNALCMGGLAVLLMFSGCQLGRAPARKIDFGPYRVVGYVGGRADISRIDPFKLTHINYAFAKINEDGTLFFRRGASVQHLAKLRTLKNINPDLKIILSVGGWGADHFSDAALDAASRRHFAEQVIQFITNYGLDGIDLDWEYPGQPGPGIKYREEDKQNFTLLLKTVREHLDELSAETEQSYLLTIATGGSARYFEHTEMGKVHPYLDFINIMSYDFYTIGSRTTGHHTGLFSSAAAANVSRNTEAAVDLHLAAGIPANKVVVGVAFYGRGWTGVVDTNNGLYQSYDRFTRSYSYELLKDDYIEKRGFIRLWDASARAPYLWQPDSSTFISYEDASSLTHKAHFIKEKALGGIMFWEYSLDHDGTLLDTLVKTLENQR